MLKLNHHLLLSLRLLLLLLLPLTPALVSPAMPPHHQAPGYLGNLSPPPTRDFLTSTYCFCSLKDRLPKPHKNLPYYDEGHYFQWDYYNHHANTTFVLDQVCPRNHHQLPGTCAHPGIHTGAGAADDLYSWSDLAEVCEQWRYDDDGRLDVLCISTGHNGLAVLGEWIHFNGQRRTLEKHGRQGRVETPHEEVVALCGGLCEEMLGVPLEVEGVREQCRQEVFVEMDDMCEGCA